MELNMNSSLSGRETEASVLEKAAALLSECKKNWDSEGYETRLNDALRFNGLVWNIFKGEISKGTSPLPVELRQNLLQLADFIEKRSEEIKKAPAADKLDILVNININIASGLRGSPQD